MDLLALADFTLVARHGGFGRAARESGRPKATLSRRVADLESGLNLRLFERGPRVLKLTEEGRALYEKTSVLLAQLDESTTAIASGGGAPRGRLRVSAPLLFSQAAMGKLAARFALQHREVRLEVTTEDRPVDMVEEGYDLVIRVNPDPDERLVGRIFMRDRIVVVASPELGRPSGATPVPAVLRGGAGADAAAPATTWDLTDAKGKPKRLAVQPVLHLSSLFMVRDAVRAQVGAACLPLSLVLNDLAASTLVQWGEVPSPEIALWALYPSRRLLSPRVSAFLDLLKEAFPQGTPQELAAYIA
ncbi:LysR family transcriptional regulator [Acidovorax sp. Root219]|uniref:LysR family transcriptional regulator n=1 Tax=Acidovorax sp. Root219 TaxID=1736493 RepID=UPI0007095847|nr:LysR family transcriptional regulator [Acidovorax sp. Root219]KRC22480.1 LysR family transcriptional regulator [Acidovorax sp. Root219]